MNPRDSLSRRCRNFSLILLALLAGWIAPAAAQPAAAPYVFFLLDTSGSMNYSPPCTQSQIDAGECGFLCPTGDCFVPMQGDDPASKLYQLKEGLSTSIALQDYVLFGLASFNQDVFSVRAKHWIYQATSNGPSVGTWGPFPAAGAQEVFGLNWTCDTGNNDNEIGCYSYSNRPADLDDPWELARVQRLPKGGLSFSTIITFYIRYAGIIYKVSYTPTGSGPGASSIQTNVSVYQCINLACSTSSLVGTQTVSWTRVGDFISWDNADSANTNRANPMLTYFSQLNAADTLVSNTCAGWDPNTDTSLDRYPNSAGYSLRWPTDSSDSRGTYFTKGDVIPLDWHNDHRLDIAAHLAPNLAINPTATPDFRIATYLNDNRSGSDTFLRLKIENSRPLIASGATPLGGSMASFKTWYAGWQAVAAVQDPYWLLRHTAVVLLTDGGGEDCGGDPCAQASTLYSQYGIRTFVVAFGGQAGATTTLDCTAANGGTTAPYYPQTKQELIDDLALIYTAAGNP